MAQQEKPIYVQRPTGLTLGQQILAIGWAVITLMLVWFTLRVKHQSGFAIIFAGIVLVVMINVLLTLIPASIKTALGKIRDRAPR